DAKSSGAPPFHAARTGRLFGGDHELERFRDADDGVHLQACSALGKIANHAIHHRGLAVENDLPGLERSVAFQPASIFHRSLPEEPVTSGWRSRCARSAPR